MAPEKSADALKRLAVAVQRKKRGGRTVAAQPAAGLARAGGTTLLATINARDAPFAALDAPVMEDFGKAGIVGDLEAQALAADRARGLVLQGIEGDGGDVGLARLFLHRFAANPLALSLATMSSARPARLRAAAGGRGAASCGAPCRRRAGRASACGFARACRPCRCGSWEP